VDIELIGNASKGSFFCRDHPLPIFLLLLLFIVGVDKNLFGCEPMQVAALPYSSG
jgi:hypothetical protein